MGVMKLIRLILGYSIIFLDWLTRPRKRKYTQEEAAKVETACKSLTLYEFYLCPFCIKVRRHMHRLNLPIQQKDAKRNKAYELELIEGGKKRKVPCLRIERDSGTEWMYESSQIKAYLSEQFK
tara:strand:+ start:210 stop:578 length:369 start_codon:yes stop_codon:yes gene_type:complete